MMASATSPRPLSSSSRAIAPLPGVSQAAAAMSPESATSPTTPQSLTAKQWVIPPRPKPGRKPATDTPPTKRKAQNRAAQRAFRERRAAKVGELEDQIDEIEKEHEGIVASLRSEIEALRLSFDTKLNESLGSYENQVRLLQAEIGGWRAHSIQLEEQVKAERKCRLAMESELAVSRGQAVRLPPRNSVLQTQTTQNQNHGSRSDQIYHTPEETILGCAKCSREHCQCLEDVMDVDTTAEDRSSFAKRSVSPSLESTNSGKRLKRSRPNSPAPLFDEESAPGHLNRPIESCGFCQEGSTCPCAEIAAEKERVIDHSGSRLPSPPRELTEQNTSAGSGNPTSQHALQGGFTCHNKPGTCTQCQSNSQSKRFCQTLAATQSTPAVPEPIELQPSSYVPINTIVPCAAGAACCRVSSALSSLRSGLSSETYSSTELDFTTPANRHDVRPPASTSSPAYSTPHAASGPVLSCADAFTTLSKHPAFDQASKDYGEWLPKLATVSGTKPEVSISVPNNTPVVTPSSGSVEQAPARTAFDIEAASVMGVLRFFDRRFGRDM